MIKNHFKIAWRNIYNHKTHSLINIGGLAISMSVVILIALWIQNELRFDNYHRDVERIYLLSEYDEDNGTLSQLSPYAAYPAIREEIPDIQGAATVTNSGQALYPVISTGPNDHFYEENTLYIDSNWVQLFDYEVLEGSLNIFNHPSNQIAISRSKAEQYFGSESALGQTMLIDSTLTTVGAVYADVPTNSSFRQDILIPIDILFKSDYYKHLPTDWSGSSQLIFVKLNPGANPVSTAEKINDLFKRNPSQWRKIPDRHKLIAMTDIHLSDAFADSDLPRGNKNTLGIFALLGFLLLLTACVNFVNLSIARISLRNKEIGLRKVTGAGKGQIFGQVMAETALATAISLALTVVLVIALLPHFNAHFEIGLSFSLLDINIAALVVSVYLAVMALTGIYPALLMGNITPLQLFKGKTAFNFNNQRLRNSLLVGQMVLAVCMMIGVIVIHAQFRYIQQQADGYQMDQVFRFHAPSPDKMIYGGDTQRINDHQQSLQRIKSDLLTTTAIKQVTRVNGRSLIDNPNAMEMGFQWTGYPKPEPAQKMVPLWVDHDYLSIANIEIRDGRWFDPTNESDKHNILINEMAVKTFGLKEPVVGTTFQFFDDYQGTVIGVVEDFHHASLHHPIQPVMIQLDQHGMGSNFIVNAQGGRLHEALEIAARVWKQQYPNKPFQYTFLDEEFDSLYKEDRKAMVFSLVFASLSLLISCLGVMGMAMFSAQRRIKEIGIRKVLGASVAGIVRMLSSDFVKLVLVSIVIASPIAWWAMNRWLDDFAYRIDIEWWMFAVAGLMAIVVALVTVATQAIRAAVANPVDSLRDE